MKSVKRLIIFSWCLRSFKKVIPIFFCFYICYKIGISSMLKFVIYSFIKLWMGFLVRILFSKYVNKPYHLRCSFDLCKRSICFWYVFVLLNNYSMGITFFSRGFCIFLNKPFVNLIKLELINDLWPLDTQAIKKLGANFIFSIQQDLANKLVDQQLQIVESYTFDIRIRIFSIDFILNLEGVSHLNLVTYQYLKIIFNKLVLLEQTKFCNLCEVFNFKVIMISLNKKWGDRLIAVVTPLAFVFQRCLLLLIDVLFENILDLHIYGFRINRTFHSCLGTITYATSFLNQFNEICIGQINFKYWDIEYTNYYSCYPVPRRLKFLLTYLFNSDIYILEFYQLKHDFFYKKLVFYFLCLGRLLNNLFVNLVLAPIFYRFTFPFKINFFFFGNLILILSHSMSNLNFYIQKIETRLQSLDVTVLSNMASIINVRTIAVRFLSLQLIWTPFKFSKLACKTPKRTPMHKFQSTLLNSPLKKIIRRIHLQIKALIKSILHVKQYEISTTFYSVHSILLGWGFFFFFQSLFIFKQLDFFIWKWIKRVLIQKYRLNGIRQVAWISRRFLGLYNINPNSLKWQISTKYYFKFFDTFKKAIFIWQTLDTFQKTSIIDLRLPPHLINTNYYLNTFKLVNLFQKLVLYRFVHFLKLVLFKVQVFRCFICFSFFQENSLISRNSKSHFCFLDKNIYILLHQDCYHRSFEFVSLLKSFLI
jgi:hypothetical protein